MTARQLRASTGGAPRPHGRRLRLLVVDGVHTRVRLGEDQLLPGDRGGRVDATKDLVAARDGYRESTESWAALLRDLRQRGFEAPVVAVGDGALGFWAALQCDD